MSIVLAQQPYRSYVATGSLLYELVPRP
jgi:hypothetical protein